MDQTGWGIRPLRIPACVVRPVAFGAALLAVTLCFRAGVAYADKVGPPSSYLAASRDKKFVLVMISPRADGEGAEAWDIRAKYKRSGLYKNDGSTDPVWTVDEYFPRVRVSSDGVHFVGITEVQPLASAKPLVKENLQGQALTFFANGKAVRTYTVAELVDRPEKLRRSVSHYMWLDFAFVLEKEGQLELRTLDRNEFMFELKTGKILKKEPGDQK